MSCETVQARAVVLGMRPGLIELAVTRQSACACCSERCGSRDAPPRAQKIWIRSEHVHHAGEEMAIEVPQDQILRSALWVYGLPLSGFIAGLLLGNALGEIAALAGSLIGLSGGFALAAWQSRRFINPLRLLPGEKHD